MDTFETHCFLAIIGTMVATLKLVLCSEVISIVSLIIHCYIIIGM